MSNRVGRMIAAAVLVLAGALLHGAGLVAFASSPQRAEDCMALGAVFLFVGSVLFLVDYVRSWWPDADRRADQGPQR